MLSGFSYSSSSVTYGDGSLAVVAPTGAQTPVTYAATPVAVCTVEPDTGALTIVGLGNCVVTASAAGDANYEAAAVVTFTVQVLSAGMLSVALETIADDDIVNAAEHELGFAISGTVTTGGRSQVERRVGDGGGRRDGADGDDGERRDVVGECRVGCELRGRAERDGDGGGDEDQSYRCIRGDAPPRRDLTPPSSPGYTAPSSLQVGVAMGALSPSTPATPTLPPMARRICRRVWSLPR